MPSDPSVLRTLREHRIAEITYSGNRLDCSCGATMTADLTTEAWRQHRRDVGAPDRTLSGAHAPERTVWTLRT
jgi:hypothetical protein